MRVDRGASAVGQLDLLPESEAWWVRALRLWCDGDGGQAVLRDDLKQRFGEQGAATVFARFTDLLSMKREDSPDVDAAVAHGETGDPCGLVNVDAVAAQSDPDDIGKLGIVVGEHGEHLDDGDPAPEIPVRLGQFHADGAAADHNPSRFPTGMRIDDLDWIGCHAINRSSQQGRPAHPSAVRSPAPERYSQPTFPAPSGELLRQC